MNVTALDTETTLIGPLAVTPRLICASFADANGTLLLGNGDSLLGVFLKEVLSNDHVVCHNVGFDLAVIAKAFPKLIPTIVTALEDGRIHDTILREKLIYLGTTGDLEAFHGKRIEYSLAALAYRRLGVDLAASKSGPDIWRLRFGELDGKKAQDYPKEAAEYAKRDASVTREIFLDQEPHAPLFKPAPLHVKAALCLQLMSDRGLKVNAAKLHEIEERTQKELDALTLVYEPVVAGVPLITPARGPQPFKKQPGKFTVPVPEKCNKKAALQPLVEQVCKAANRPVKLTKKGSTSTKIDFLRELRHLHPNLSEFVERAERIKLKTDYFPAHYWQGQVASVVHPRYDALKKTGRVSSSGNSKKRKDPLFPAVHIQAADPRIREIYEPRAGFVYAIADYNAIDLCSAAQTMHDLFGGSALGEQINAGVDPHAFLGAILALEEDVYFRETADGLSGEEAFDAFQAMKNSSKACPCQGKVKHKPGAAGAEGSWYEHWRTFGKVFGLGVPGGMGLDTLCSVAAGYGLAMDRDTATRLRKRYFQAHPEIKRYLRQWVPEQADGEDRFRYVSPLGMVRAGCSYTEFANGRALQTPAAEGFKTAMWRVTKECLLGAGPLAGSFPVINMHDELVLEVPEDRAAPAAERLSQLMIEGMGAVLKDIVIRAEPVLTDRWTKGAKAVRDPVKGTLKVWRGAA